MKKVVMISLVLVLSLIPWNAFADDYGVKSLRCSAGSVEIGDNKIEVLARCGQPLRKDSIISWFPRHSDHDPAEVEEWTYNFGSSDHIYTMRFEGAELVKINRGGRGF